MSTIQSRWTVRTMTALVLTGFLFGVSIICAAGGIEFRETDTLPYVENILFNPSSVGIVSQDGRLFRVDRQVQDVQQLDAQTFAQQFPKPWPPKPSDSPQYGPKILRTTGGEEFEQTPGSCDEGVDEAHVLRYQQRRFPDVLKPCSTVTALEIIGPQVWLGTATFGEGGDGKAEGIVVQAWHKRQKLQSITAQSGLTGGVIRMLRDDPFTKTVWVATERGINQIDRRFRVTWSRYWYEEFEPSSRKSQTFLSPRPRTSNPFAVLGRELGVEDWVAFSRAVEQVSPAERNNLRLYDFHMYGFPAQSLSHDLNGLVPFFIQAAQSHVEAIHLFGLSNLCKFEDPRVQAFLVTMEPTTVKDSAGQGFVQDCLKARAAQP
ncbi:MAG: hypothetical protein K2Q17_09850 [Nitrospiraceae bacterium]|uniref:hypothetical protein n=1 Tax=Nitrospira cf. moscoviensis SBR1015 TaxID=96242 RepID=UPI000A0A67B7|nr:hypothetical protein [Nitrospira cf. moscoviensis SBR1015]MBY0247960.1 hypothetical protein [Nitrospiraceae bacterium]OQW37083.1 MAG: hypothetical protein A4E20_05325 [Nitrospira sp. SG-bin2]